MRTLTIIFILMTTFCQAQDSLHYDTIKLNPVQIQRLTLFERQKQALDQEFKAKLDSYLIAVFESENVTADSVKRYHFNDFKLIYSTK